MKKNICKCKFEGMRYSFEVVLEDYGYDVKFYIRATCKKTKRTSCINNLNPVLSELLTYFESDNYACYPEYRNTTWMIKKGKAKRFIKAATSFLSDSRYVSYLERKLDEDRFAGEYEKIITDDRKIVEKESVEHWLSK